MTDLVDLEINEALDLLNKKEISSVELTEAYLNEMEKGRMLNAYITETPDIARQKAKESDIRRANGQAQALDGIPFAQKDLFCTKGVLTTAASKILSKFVPPYESTVTDKLNQAGVVLLGKLNTDQFAMGISTITSYFGAVKNPWTDENGQYTLVPGGSSGGTAAAVSAGLCMAATGTDTGGSVRQPSSFCGVTGIKPTYGRCSRYGVIAFASSLDQPAVAARSVTDCALVLQQMAGYDPKDSTSANLPVPDFSALLSQDIKGKKIGIPKEYRLDGLNSDVAKAWDRGADLLKQAGAEIQEVSLPHTKYALPTYYIIAPAEASSNLSRYDGVRYTTRVAGDSIEDLYKNTRTDGFGDEVIRRILLGTFVLSAGFYDAYYIRAQKVRRLIFNDFKAAFEKVDALLVPSAPTPALSQEEILHMSPVDTFFADVFTIPPSLAGLPTMNVPVALSEKGLPIGLQVIGRHFCEDQVLQIGHALETAAGFNRRPHRVKGK